MNREELRIERDRDRRYVLSELASLVTHQLHQPLTAIVNYAASARSSLAQTHPDPKELAHMLERISEQAFRAADVSRRLRNLVRRPGARPEPIGLREVVQQVWSELPPREGWRLENDIAESTKVHFDRIQFRFVVEEILSNCADSLALSSGPEQCLRVHTQAFDAENIEWIIEDSGDGFEASVMEDLFTPFQSTREGRLGLGLSIARSIVADHGGRLRVDPPETGGARLRLTLEGVH